MYGAFLFSSRSLSFVLLFVVVFVVTVSSFLSIRSGAGWYNDDEKDLLLFVVVHDVLTFPLSKLRIAIGGECGSSPSSSW